MIFVRSSYEPLFRSNYYAILALKSMNWTGLYSNLGFRISVFLTGFFCLLLIFAKITEFRLTLRQKFLFFQEEEQNATKRVKELKYKSAS